LEKELGVKNGETTPDQEFSLQAVRCLGACALAPVMIVGERYFDKMTPAKVHNVLKLVQRKDGKSSRPSRAERSKKLVATAEIPR
jgi:NADH:ubiquinone oxidoreductase subunit E